MGRSSGLGAPDAVHDPLLFATLLARLGAADAVIAGSSRSSASVLRTAIIGLGAAHPGALVSGCFVIGDAVRK